MLDDHAGEGEWILPQLPAEDIIVPGLTPRHPEVHDLAQEVSRRLRAFQYKQRVPSLWLVFLGGTGTGKSTLFNALCGRPLSQTGVERPKTRGPVAYAHASVPVETGFPFQEVSPERRTPNDTEPSPQGGAPGKLVVIEHQDPSLSHLVLVDTPDLDSLEEENRRVSRILALLADAVVFVASQEKYADDVPSAALRRLIDEEKPLYFLLNKTDPGFAPREALQLFEAQGIHLDESAVWAVPRRFDPAPKDLSEQPGVQSFHSRLMQDFPASSATERRARMRGLDARGIAQRIDRLLERLHAEDEAARAWRDRLEALFRETSEDLVRAESEHFTSRNRKPIQRQIRRLFSRYDLLSGPRKAVRRVIRTPLRLLGLDARKDEPEDRLEQARSPENLAPILAAVDRFGRRALEDLSPQDETAPLYDALRRPGVTMDRDEVEARVRAEQERMEAWLRETFDTMARGLPAAKRWSIYSTSIVWGILVLALEATLGGGFTVIDALLGSAVAPFLTKGSAELFAYREIQKVVREMADRYRKGLIAILQEQRDRYASALESVSTPPEALSNADALRKDLTP